MSQLTDGRLNMFKREWDSIASPAAFLRSVIYVFEEMKASGEEPGSEQFSNFPEYFGAYALPRVRETWAKETGCDPMVFPYSVGFVMYTWTSWRKAVSDRKRSIRTELRLPHPEDAEEPAAV